ncbi:MAG: hypothetical protein KY464_02640 [Gemmatimonadetes bacterium]|nr:hypothetical protein [Gemmatimonadota bacterium]
MHRVFHKQQTRLARNSPRGNMPGTRPEACHARAAEPALCGYSAEPLMLRAAVPRLAAALDLGVEALHGLTHVGDQGHSRRHQERRQQSTRDSHRSSGEGHVKERTPRPHVVHL